MSFLLKLFKSKTKHVNITICGLDKAGKTTIVRYLVAGTHKETIPTMGVNREIIDLPKLQMDVFDLGGQEDFRGLWGDINEKADGLIYVIDSTDFVRMQETKDIFYNIINTQINQLIPVMILLNKADLEGKISRPEFMRFFGLFELTTIKWSCFETSALTGLGLYESFKWFIDCFQED
ncbi:MAG TPA: Arf family protein [candidate division Zixibacteria bacterium]|nr:Arf family protein [candidate division Zixibacteria bacterium]